MTSETTARTALLAVVLLAALAGCGESTKLIGTGEGALTNTPCTTCDQASRPQCAAGETVGCFKRAGGSCGWADHCSGPAQPDAGTGSGGNPGGGGGGGAGGSTPQPGPTCRADLICPAIYCPNGRASDANGCPTCECKPGSGGDPAADAGVVCPAIACPAIACANGTQTDARGCPTCKCNPAPSCAAVTCPMGQRCELHEVMCVRAPCPPQPVCVPASDPAPNPCAAALCPQGTVCQVREVMCVRAPCPPIAECVPRCGGIAGRPCPGAGSCQDDPSDTCDPARGGADCGGLCACKEPAGACPPDRIWDGSPRVCACVPVSSVVPCGQKMCSQGEFCCNPSCSVCAPMGGACDQMACR